jgi:hypothetical protein
MPLLVRRKRENTLAVAVVQQHDDAVADTAGMVGMATAEDKIEEGDKDEDEDGQRADKLQDVAASEQ